MGRKRKVDDTDRHTHKRHMDSQSHKQRQRCTGTKGFYGSEVLLLCVTYLRC